MMVRHASENARLSFLKTCRCCGTAYTLMLDPQDLFDWHNGEGFIQDLMPYLSTGERELLISGTCGRCFDEMFPEDVDIEE